MTVARVETQLQHAHSHVRSKKTSRSRGHSYEPHNSLVFEQSSILDPRSTPFHINSITIYNSPPLGAIAILTCLFVGLLPLAASVV